MEKVKIKIIQYGQLPKKINYKEIMNHKSSIFKVVNCECIPYMPDCDNGKDYIHYSDEQWKCLVPQGNQDVDLVFGITNFALDGNFYSRRLGNGRVIFSFFHIREHLNNANIPLENVIIQQFYAYGLYLTAHKSFDNVLMCHDETRGCLYDMNGNLSDIVFGCQKLNLCGECQNTLLSWGFTKKEVKEIIKELNKVKKPLFYIIVDFIKCHPVLALIISFMISVLSDLTSSGIIYLWQKLFDW